MKRDRTPARVRANRANARASTGPKTTEGLARSAQNAAVHGFRAHVGGYVSEVRVTQLANLIAGPKPDPATLALATAVAAAHLQALLARRLSATAWGVFRDDHPMNRSLVDTLDDPVMADLLDPEMRRHIRGHDQVDARELRLVARIRAYAVKLRVRHAHELTRRIGVLDRYEGQAAARLRAAIAAYTTYITASKTGGPS